MVVPFGFGIGDFLAVLTLIRKVGLELKKNSKSAPDYQEILIELEAFHRALKQLQCIKPVQDELKRLDGIRALVSMCRASLEEFLNKINKFEEHLGSQNASKHHFSGLNRRLQWSIKYSEAVTSLRKRLAPNVTTITVLLMTQTIDTLSTAHSDRVRIAQELDGKLISQYMMLGEMKQLTLDVAATQARLEAEHSHLRASAAAQDQDLSAIQSKADDSTKDHITHELHLRDQDATLVDIQGNSNAIMSQTQATYVLATDIRRDTAETKVLVSSVFGQAHDIMSAVKGGISRIQEISALIVQMIRMTTQFTIEMRENMRKLLMAFWAIQQQLARLERFLPKQIDLLVVRFRDAFNEMRYLPYDLSRNWHTFQGLVAVVFTNRQGLHRVNLGQYFITNVRTGRKVNPTFWTNAIEPGDELSMTMVLDDVEVEDGFCPHKSCGASLRDVALRQGGRLCPSCSRFAAISERHQAPPLEVEALVLPIRRPEPDASGIEDIELYHSIQVSVILPKRNGSGQPFTNYDYVQMLPKTLSPAIATSEDALALLSQAADRARKASGNLNQHMLNKAAADALNPAIATGEDALALLNLSQAADGARKASGNPNQHMLNKAAADALNPAIATSEDALALLPQAADQTREASRQDMQNGSTNLQSLRPSYKSKRHF